MWRAILECLHKAGWNVKMVWALWGSLVVPPEVKDRVTMWLSNSIPKHMFQRNSCVQIFIAALFIIAKCGNSPHALELMNG